MKHCTLILSLFALSALSFAQNIITGTAIPDTTARHFYYYALSQLPANLLNDTLTNDLGMSAADVSSTTSAINDFRGQHSAAESLYARQIGIGSNTVPLQTLNSSFATITSNTQTFLKQNLSASSYAAIENEIQYAKTEMAISDGKQLMPMIGGINTCTGMQPQYGSTRTRATSVLSRNPLNIAVTTTVTISGTTLGQGSDCSLITHTLSATSAIGTWETQTKTAGGPMTGYYTATAAVTLTTQGNPCLTVGAGNLKECQDKSNSSVFCSFIANNIFNWSGFGVDIEWAETFAANIGQVPGSCVGGVCNWNVQNFCTPGTNPPDQNVNGTSTRDIYYPNWWEGALCASANIDILGNGHQPWHCSSAIAVGVVSILFPQPCTSHP